MSLASRYEGAPSPGGHAARQVRVYSAVAALTFGVALIGGWATRIGPWYRSLRTPAWRPPNWAFAPAWTAIFALVAVSAGMAWTHARTSAERRDVVLAFGANAVLNMAWSVLFFRFERPDWALAEVAGLWLSVVLAMVATGRIKAMPAWLLAPYLAWVSFASVLNAAIVKLNAPF